MYATLASGQYIQLVRSDNVALYSLVEPVDQTECEAYIRTRTILKRVFESDVYVIHGQVQCVVEIFKCHIHLQITSHG